MRYALKYHTIRFASLLLRGLHLLPVRRNRILFATDEGEQYGCNPKCVFESLVATCGKRFEYVWVLNDPTLLPEKYRNSVKTVRYLSPGHILHLSTAAFIVTNMGIEPFMAKRKSQIVINTHHGGGSYKTYHTLPGVLSPSEERYTRRLLKLRARITDFVLSANAKFTAEHSADLMIAPARFLPTGTPRNDRFFYPDPTAAQLARERFCRSHDVPCGSLLVLYAPTFRGTHRHSQPITGSACHSEVAAALKERFGKEVMFLFRRHRHLQVSDSPSADGVAAVDVCGYSDMQELLEIADILITDYSSSIWDFCLTLKPGFLYMPDLEQFRRQRGFYTPLDRWPYPHATSIDGLCRIIREYSQPESCRRIAAHIAAMGSFERGTASEAVVRLITEHLNKNLLLTNAKKIP